MPVKWAGGVQEGCSPLNTVQYRVREQLSSPCLSPCHGCISPEHHYWCPVIQIQVSDTFLLSTQLSETRMEAPTHFGLLHLGLLRLVGQVTC